jgi:3-phosphoshikimate 1-carboxyvinyltransferase
MKRRTTDHGRSTTPDPKDVGATPPVVLDRRRTPLGAEGAEELTIRPAGRLRGRVRVPGDKSISHRAALFGALAEGTSHIEGYLPSGDCMATLDCLRALGVEIEGILRPAQDAPLAESTLSLSKGALTVYGRGLRGLRAPGGALSCVRSGTTMRLLAGILAGQPFDAAHSVRVTLTGEPQLLRRPMRRITDPLRHMGAEIEDQEGCAPLVIHGRPLHGTVHSLNVASAQVKSALLLAGLYADGPTVVRQCGPARDHTERMLAAMGVEIEVDGLDVTLRPPAALSPLALRVPGDLSSAAFVIVAALLVPGAEVTVERVGINPTRTGLLDVLWAMGAQVAVEREGQQGGEPVADLVVRSTQGRHTPLHGTTVQGDVVVRMIDEFPILAVAATQASGETVVRDAAELRVKETDRIATVVAELRKLGARIEPYPDGFRVSGPTPLHGATVDSHGDHRLGMALAVAGLVAEGETVVQNAGCIADSFPGFAQVLDGLT